MAFSGFSQALLLAWLGWTNRTGTTGKPMGGGWQLDHVRSLNSSTGFQVRYAARANVFRMSTK